MAYSALNSTRDLQPAPARRHGTPYRSVCSTSVRLVARPLSSTTSSTTISLTCSPWRRRGYCRMHLMPSSWTSVHPAPSPRHVSWPARRRRDIHSPGRHHEKILYMHQDIRPPYFETLSWPNMYLFVSFTMQWMHLSLIGKAPRPSANRKQRNKRCTLPFNGIVAVTQRL